MVSGNWLFVCHCPTLSIKDLWKYILQQNWTTLWKKCSEYQTGFWNDFNLQMSLAAMIGKIGTALYQRGEYVVLPTDLCKTFDCLPYDLLNTKLQAHGFDMVLSTSIQSYLLDGYQRMLELL